MFWVYILENPAAKFYVGQTDDLLRRLIEHNNLESASGKYTHKNGPRQIIYHKLFPTRSEAMAREKWLKGTTGRGWMKKQDFLPAVEGLTISGISSCGLEFYLHPCKESTAGSFIAR